ncbi:MFS transporter [Streptomyces sp. NPDC093510]|uniref:MFS transporter n=1 Tax=Streptomyces sp. NPDC093510 TaxID=3155199 RepID=UPI00344A6A67
MATGIAFLPHTLVGVAGARLAPAVMRRTGARALIVSAASLSAAGFVWQSLIDADSTYWEGLLGPAVVMSAGMGLLITPITTTVTSGIAEQDAGAASGLMNATRQIGGAIGLAALLTPAATASGTSTAGAYRTVFLAIAAVCAAVAALAFTLPAPPRTEQPRRGRSSPEDGTAPAAP